MLPSYDSRSSLQVILLTLAAVLVAACDTRPPKAETPAPEPSPGAVDGDGLEAETDAGVGRAETVTVRQKRRERGGDRETIGGPPGDAIMTESDPTPSFSAQQLTETMLTDLRLAHIKWSRWSGTPCPDSVLALERYADGSVDRDGWGNQVKILCGDDVPREAGAPFAVVSAGPDGRFGTRDDINSWSVE